MQSEKIQARIETYTADLPRAVQSPNGAQFAMLLSLIASNQEIYEPQPAPATGDGSFSLESQASRYPDPNEFYTQGVVDRLNRSVNAGERGEYAYLVSHIDVHSHLPRSGRLAADSFARVALETSGRMMLETVERSRKAIEVSA